MEELKFSMVTDKNDLVCFGCVRNSWLIKKAEQLYIKGIQMQYFDNNWMKVPPDKGRLLYEIVVLAPETQGKDNQR